MNLQKLHRYLPRFSRARVMVVGDLILDHYIWGQVSRISPEAPVPVVHVDSESFRPGGAANVYTNIISLGGYVEVCGVVGPDESGKILQRELGRKPQGKGGIVVDAQRPTTKKTRVLAHSQQVVRYDVEHRHDISPSARRSILRYIESRLPDMSCLVVSDYAKGVVTAALMAELGRMARTKRIPIVVDPKVEHFPYYAGVTVITPNHLEAQQNAGLAPTSPNPIHEIGHHLRQKLGCEAVLITRGEHGMSLCEADGSSWDIPAMARQVYDVTGAGDTVVSTLALAISSGASLRESAILANHAAGMAVGMIGTVGVTKAQLKEALQRAAE